MSSLIVFFEQVAKSALILVDDVVVLAKPALSRIGDATAAAKMAATSATDDTLPLAKLAMKKAGAVVVDDTAVSSDQLNESAIEQHREYAVWRKIVVGSLVNKVMIQTVIMVTGAIAPVVPHVMLACGAGYLAYEGAHKTVEYAHHLRRGLCAMGGLPSCEPPHKEKSSLAIISPTAPRFKMPVFIDKFLGSNPKERAVLTDLILLDAILSTEILLVANGTLGDVSALIQTFVLFFVGLATTLGVYGVVLAIVRADNVAGYFANPSSRLYMPKVAQGLMAGLPYVLKLVGVIGTMAMLGVAGDVAKHLLPLAFEASGALDAAHVVHGFFESIPRVLDFLPWGAETLGGMLTGFFFGALLLGAGKVAHVFGQHRRAHSLR